LQKHPVWPRLVTSSFAAPCSATVNYTQIGGHKYLLYFNMLIDRAMASQIWPHLAVLVLTSSLRYATPAAQTQSIPAMPTHDLGAGFLAAEMKEYDA
jgi:hypothetical protein